jgi:chromosome segregation and condensation protein ScpB
MSEVVTPLLVGQLEAVLFASDAPLPTERIAEVLEISPLDARAALDALRVGCDEPGRGLSVVEVGGGWRLVTRPEHGGVLMSLQRLRLKSRLSRAAVETLTIVAYRQPISSGSWAASRRPGARSSTGRRASSWSTSGFATWTSFRRSRCLRMRPGRVKL